jgi:hypothetical protein
MHDGLSAASVASWRYVIELKTDFPENRCICGDACLMQVRNSWRGGVKRKRE